MIKKTKRTPHEANAGEKFDFITSTLKILSRKIYRNPSATPIAKLEPVPPLLLTDDTDIAIIVSIKQDSGIVNLFDIFGFYRRLVIFSVGNLFL